MTPEIKEKLSKIYELVKHGATEGEKAAASNALNKLLEKYNLTGIDLESIDKSVYDFTYTTMLELRLFGRLMKYFWPDEDMRGTRTNKQMSIWLTYMDYVLIDSAYEYFRRHMKEQWNKVCAADVKRKRKSATKNKRRKELQDVFFNKYIISSKLYHDNELITCTGAQMTEKELRDLALMEDVQGGRYRTQVQNGNMLNQKN